MLVSQHHQHPEIMKNHIKLILAAHSHNERDLCPSNLQLASQLCCSIDVSKSSDCLSLFRSIPFIHQLNSHETYFWMLNKTI